VSLFACRRRPPSRTSLNSSCLPPPSHGISRSAFQVFLAARFFFFDRVFYSGHPREPISLLLISPLSPGVLLPQREDSEAFTSEDFLRPPRFFTSGKHSAPFFLRTPALHLRRRSDASSSSAGAPLKGIIPVFRKDFPLLRAPFFYAALRFFFYHALLVSSRVLVGSF